MKKNTDEKKIAFIVTIVIALLLMAVALMLFTDRNSRRITEQNREYLVDNAREVADSIDSALSEGYANIKMLTDLVSESLTGPEFNVSNIQSHIQNSVFDFIEFADKDGMDHNITGGVSDAHDRQYYLDAKEGNSGMELIYVSRATHETLLMFYTPLYYEKEFVGSLVGVYQASNRLTKLLTTEYFGEKATAYLATDEGRIIASNQGFDPQQELYVTDLAEGNEELRQQFSNALLKDGVTTFTLPDNKTGGCIMKLPVNGGYLVQIFPPEASRRMINRANALGYVLVAFIMLLNAAIILSLIQFYHEQQRRIGEAKNQAEIASQAKTSFLFNMSHDIRTPMNAIMGYTDIGLRHVENEDRTRDAFEKIKTAGAHLLNLINDILEMSRIESGKLELSENPMDIRDSIKSVNQMSLALAIPKSIDFRTVVGEIRNPYILSDELHINEVIINLISNAIKYTNDGGKVVYSAEQIGEVKDGMANFRFTVSDNGIGMSLEFQEHLFENFSRENTATVSRQEGSGLGLAIVKKIVDMSGGTISVKSLKNEGSIFTVDLPFKVLSAEEEEKFKSAQLKAQETGNEGGLEGRRVLLVEDNELNREIATELLEGTGLLIETADDGDIAVDIFEKRGIGYYDFILMDIQMPVMNGYDATRLIRKLPGGSKVPIIALSANAFKEDIDKSLESGMNAHVAKPIDVKNLLSTMHLLSDY